jgi:hypothetical protein
MTTFRAGLIWLALTTTVAHADTWFLKPEVRDSESVFSDVRVVLHYDSTKNPAIPEYSLRIIVKDRLVAEHKGVGFKQVFASPDKAYFLGTSNSGLTRDAYVVFSRDGKILKRQSHNSKDVKYGMTSVTLIRQWYDDKKPDVKFEVNNGILKDITINGYDGSHVSLSCGAAETKRQESGGTDKPKPVAAESNPASKGTDKR